MFIFVISLLTVYVNSEEIFFPNMETEEIRMPAVVANLGEQYLCRALKVDSQKEKSIVGFLPHASMHNVHHMILYGCTDPGTDRNVWDCREMYRGNNKSSPYITGRVCNYNQRVIYAWAKDAPELKLPEGVGFKIGGNSGINYLVLQVHYMHPLSEPDSSGLSIIKTTNQLPKTAGVLFIASNGVLRANSIEKFEITCHMNDNVVIHPFAYRVHTHEHGRVVSGYLLRDGNWNLIGKQNPQLPQMFYPVVNPNMTIRSNDIVAARCTMVNDDDHDVFIGEGQLVYLCWDLVTDRHGCMWSATGFEYVRKLVVCNGPLIVSIGGPGPRADNEMCNYYLMYWVDGDAILSRNSCFSNGPPIYYWKAELPNIPDVDASSL